MLRSSLGFHTMTIFLPLEHIEVRKLISDFKRYSQNTGLIQMYLVDQKGTYTKYQPPHNNEIIPLNLKIVYHQKNPGIKWLIRHSTWSESFKSYIVAATINPKILAGISDYITAATYDDMEAAMTNFNHEAERISSLLKTFDFYYPNRIDYCVNFDLNELVPECDPERVMALMKRADIPPYYEEWTEYDSTAHRKKSKPGSFYLTSPSVTINCYNKYMQLLERAQEKERNGYPPIPQAILNAAQGIIRFEVQCKYHKIYALSNKIAKEPENENRNIYQALLSRETCSDIINHYYNRIIKKEDWYSLQKAIHKIELHNFNRQRENRLIKALKLIAQCRSIPQAKEALAEDELKVFKKTLKELSLLDINPVTIPKEWGIQHIPNLLYAYYNKLDMESTLKWMEEFQPTYLESFKKKRGIS